MSIVVIGFGKSGQSAAKLAKQCGYDVKIVDENISESMLKKQVDFEHDGIQVELGVQSCDLSGVIMIIQSPGVPPTSSLAQMAERSEIEVVSEIEFAAMNTDIPLLAVTGTNGKTTTTELTTHLLNELGYKVCAVGNIGTTLSEVVTEGETYDYLIAELSSFQLEKSPQLSPYAAAITNIASDHLDRHGDMDTYTRIKFSVLNNISEPNRKVINEQLFAYWNENVSKYELPILFSAYAEADYRLDGGDIVLDDKKIVDLNDTNLHGEHNAENIMAALGLVSTVISQDTLFSKKTEKALQSFKPGEHRIELFAEHDGITFIDDSKGTNPDAVVAAVNAAGKEKNVCLILGGLDKGMDFTPILTVSDKIKAAFVIGECRNKIKDTLEENVDCNLFDEFESAVKAAAECAQSGDVVMLSPACASMDMFKSYKERGDIFKKNVRYLINHEAREEHEGSL